MKRKKMLWERIFRFISTRRKALRKVRGATHQSCENRGAPDWAGAITRLPMGGQARPDLSWDTSGKTRR